MLSTQRYLCEEWRKTKSQVNAWESKHLSEFILIFIYTSCYVIAPAKLNLTYRFFCEIIIVPILAES